MTKEWIRRISYWENKKTGYTRKHIVIPEEISEHAGRMCKLIWDEEAEMLIIKFSTKR